MNIANKISDIRKASGLSQDGFAKKLFVTRQAVSRWETGETTPTIDTLKLMFDTFKVDSNLFFETTIVCQSCGRPFETIEDFGSNKNKTASIEYCNPCLTEGELYPANSFDEWVDLCLQYFNNPTEQAKKEFREQLLTLKRWRK